MTSFYFKNNLTYQSLRPHHNTNRRFFQNYYQNTLFKSSTINNGGATRDRTADLMNANHALSQLSYSPRYLWLKTFKLEWWVWVDLNHRPHPYQGCALTNWATDPVGLCLLPNNLWGRFWRNDFSFFKGGDPAAGSPTATLLRLYPSHESQSGERSPEG